jgi:hypothetical protein
MRHKWWTVQKVRFKVVSNWMSTFYYFPFVSPFCQAVICWLAAGGWGRKYLISLDRFSCYMIGFGITRSLVSILCTSPLFRRSAKPPACGRKGVPSTSQGSYERRWDFGITEILFRLLTSKLVFGDPHALGARLGFLGRGAGAVREAWDVTSLTWVCRL